MHTSQLSAAAGLVLLLSSCAGGTSETASDPSPSATSTETPAPPPSTDPPSTDPPSTDPPSTSPPGAAVTGTPFTVYTHCGVESARIDGRWWHARPPVYNTARNGPPSGWGDPDQDGILTVESPDRAVFTALGRQVVFVPAPDNAPVRMCD